MDCNKKIPSTSFMASFHRDALVNNPILVDSSSGHIWRLAVLHLDWSYLSIGPVHLWSHLGCCDAAGREALGLSTHTSYEVWVSHLETLGSMWPKSNSWWVTYDATCVEAYTVRILLYAWTYEELEDAKPNKFLIPHKINEHVPDHTPRPLWRWLFILMII